MDDAQLQTALTAFEEAGHVAGSWTKLAQISGCTPGNISQLRKKGSALPSQYVLRVEAATGVSRHRLRPDLYPLTDVPTGRTVGTGAPIVSCDRGAEMQPKARA